MSDALTDIARDQRRQKIVEKIRGLEKDPQQNAEQLIRLWKEYKSIKSGYWTSSSEKLADKKIEELKKYLKGADNGKM